MKGDAAFQGSILADEYIGVAPDGRISTRAESVDEVRTGAFKAESMLCSGTETGSTFSSSRQVRVSGLRTTPSFSSIDCCCRI